MYSDKTYNLLTKYNELKEQGLRVLLCKPDIDKRFSETFVVSRKDGLKAKVDLILSVNYPDSLLHSVDLKEVKAVFIDEVQFFTENIYFTVLELLDRGVVIYVSGLTYDFKHLFFGFTHKLVELADLVVINNPVCALCDNTAERSFRFTDSTQQILIGNGDIYKPLCVSCYNKQE